MSQEFFKGNDYGSNLDFMPAESWRILRIMSEFVESFDRMGNVRQLHVSVFGSARTPKDSKYYNEAVEVGKQLVKAGYGVITGPMINVLPLSATILFLFSSIPSTHASSSCMATIIPIFINLLLCLDAKIATNERET